MHPVHSNHIRSAGFDEQVCSAGTLAYANRRADSCSHSAPHTDRRVHLNPHARLNPHTDIYAHPNRHAACG